MQDEEGDLARTGRPLWSLPAPAPVAVALLRAQRRPGPKAAPRAELQTPGLAVTLPDRMAVDRSPDPRRLAKGRPTFSALYSATMSIVDDVATIGHGEREKFERDGYLIVGDSGCSKSVLDALVTDLDGLFEGEYRREPDGVYYSDHRIMDAWRISANVRALALAPKILAILQELYGRRPLPFQTLNFLHGTEQAVHSDAIHFNSDSRWLHVRSLGRAGGHRHGEWAGRLLPGEPQAAPR